MKPAKPRREIVDREAALARVRALRRKYLKKPMSLEAIAAAIEEGRP